MQSIVTTLTAWLSTHQSTVLASWLIFSGVIIAVFKPRTGADEAAFSAAWPRLSAFVKAVDALGIDVPQFVDSIGKIIAGSPKDGEK